MLIDFQKSVLCNISRTFGFYNILINRQKALKAVFPAYKLASYVYCDAQMMEITKAQMELLEGRVPEKANEVVVSEYFLSTYGNNAGIGDIVTLDTESFHGDYVVSSIMDSINEKEANTCAIILSKAALTEWDGFDPAGYRAYAHFKTATGWEKN